MTDDATNVGQGLDDETSRGLPFAARVGSGPDTSGNYMMGFALDLRPYDALPAEVALKAFEEAMQGRMVEMRDTFRMRLRHRCDRCKEPILGSPSRIDAGRFCAECYNLLQESPPIEPEPA